MNIQLGQKVKDKYTGVIGYTTAYTVYLQGCLRFCVETGKTNNDGTLLEYWFDEERLTVVGRAKKTDKKGNGGSGSVPPARSVCKI